jgi:ribonuclease-3
LFLGKGEDSTGGRDKDSILSGTVEALIAAIYQDTELSRVRNVIDSFFVESIERLKRGEGVKDFKTTLQELIQNKAKTTPVYQVTSSTGPDHEKVFEISVLVNDKVLARGRGRSKKDAEQAAAKAALENIDITDL